MYNIISMYKDPLLIYYILFSFLYKLDYNYVITIYIYNTKLNLDVSNHFFKVTHYIIEYLNVHIATPCNITNSIWVKSETVLHVFLYFIIIYIRWIYQRNIALLHITICNNNVPVHTCSYVKSRYTFLNISTLGHFRFLFSLRSVL